MPFQELKDGIGAYAPDNITIKCWYGLTAILYMGGLRDALDTLISRLQALLSARIRR